MSIDITDAQPEQPMPIDEVQDFSIRRDVGLGQVSQSSQSLIAPR
jgi:hypothetical protein